MATSPTFKVELGRKADCIDIAALSKVAVEHGLPWRWKPSRVLGSIQNKNSSVIKLVGDAGELAAFGIMDFHELHGHISLLATHPKYRRQGMGQTLLNWFIESAKVAGLNYLGLEVRINNGPAIQFYENLGFEVQVLKKGYYEGREDAYRMILELIPADIAKGRP